MSVCLCEALCNIVSIQINYYYYNHLQEGLINSYYPLVAIKAYKSPLLNKAAQLDYVLSVDADHFYDSIPGGWPVCLWPAQWPDDHNIGKWGCHARCPSWRSAVCRFPPVTEMKDCPLLAASEATLPPLGALER